MTSQAFAVRRQIPDNRQAVTRRRTDRRRALSGLVRATKGAPQAPRAALIMTRASGDRAAPRRAERGRAWDDRRHHCRQVR